MSVELACARRSAAHLRFDDFLAAISLLAPSLDMPSDVRFLLWVLPAAALRTSLRVAPLPSVLFFGPLLDMPSAVRFLLSVDPFAVLRTSARVVPLPVVLFFGPSFDMPSDVRFLLSVEMPVYALANPMPPTSVATAAAVANSLESFMMMLLK